MAPFEAFLPPRNRDRLAKADLEESFGASMGHMSRALAYFASGSSTKGKLSADLKEAQKFKYFSSKFCLVNGELYKRASSSPLLRYLKPSDAEYVLAEIHEGIYGSHQGGKTLALKALGQGYFWPTLQKDATEYVKKCDKCQKYAPIPCQYLVELTPILSPIPFAIWGIDLLEPFP